MAKDARQSFGKHRLLTGLIILVLAQTCWAESNRSPQSGDFAGYTFSLGVADQNHANEPVEDTYLARIGVRQQWFRQEQSQNWDLRSFWEVEIGYWHWRDETSDSGGLAEFSVTPVFRLERETPYGSGVRPFVEAAVGLHLISKTLVSSRDLSSKYQFGSFVGAGWYFGQNDRYEISVQLQHLSNAGLETPNPGINYALLKFGINP